MLLGCIAFIVGVRIYNGLVYLKNQVNKSFSSVDVLLKKRWDLIPNLVAVVKHHMEFEQQTLAEVTRLRSQVMSGGVSAEQRLTLENQISRSMGIGDKLRKKQISQLLHIVLSRSLKHYT